MSEFYWNTTNKGKITLYNLCLLNNSEMSRGFCEQNYISESYAIPATVYLSIIDFLIIAGNSWVLLKILRKFRKTTYLLTSLVVSDLLTGFTSIPLYIVWIHNNELFVSIRVCFGTLLISLLLSVASILNIVAMTTEHFIAICFPIFHKSVVKVHYSLIITLTIAFIWLSSIASALSSLIFMKRDFQVCSYYNVFDGNFLVSALSLGVFSPLCLLTAMYIQMFISVRKCFKREAYEACSSLKSERSVKRQKLINKSLRKIATTLCLVLTCFIVCWGPFFVTIFLRLLCSNCVMPLLTYEVILLLGLSNSLANPVIYCLRHKSFRSIKMQRKLCVFETKGKTGSYDSYEV